jgi:hypothetical protein
MGSVEACWVCCTGHIHRQDHHVDEQGVQHFALPALLEAPPDTEGCHGIVTIDDKSLHMQGYGDMASNGSDLPRPAAPAAV